MFHRFGLYVHVPYCRTKCPYCDFNVEAGAGWPEERYVDALVAELSHAAARPPFAGKQLSTIYLGGGTPSLFSVGSIARLLNSARRAFPGEPPVEVSLEANPESVDAAKLTGYRRAGVDRLSFGIESFQPHLLKRLGRLQTAGETRRAVALAREAGFANVSIDLMFAVPGQTLDDWRADLTQVIADAPEHVSAYNLTFEEGTPFAELKRTGRLTPLDDDAEAAMFEEARSTLAAAGYLAYEVSNFARPGFESKHNSNYWRGGAYLGIGAGAHSHEPSGAHARRWSNEKDSARYSSRALAEGTAVVYEEELAPRTAAGEFVFLNLRTADGLDGEQFRERFGSSFEEMFPAAVELIAEGLVEHGRAGGIRLTRRGLLVADSVFASFV